MFNNIAKTFLLMFGLSSLFLSIGYYLSGTEGLIFAFIMALIMNFISFFFSDKIVLNLYRAKPLDQHTYAGIHEDVAYLSKKMNMPKPKLWLVTSPVANAFATGRGPGNASVAVTTGILEILNEEELRGVLAHELSHVKNRDILIGTIAATLATAISYLAYMARYAAFWGSSNSNNERSNNPIGMLFIGMFAPLAATLVQLGITRSREYQADESGAYATREPLALASALEKLEQNAKRNPTKTDMRYAPTSSLGIVKPFSGKSLLSLFSTHPPMRDRIKRLHELQQKIY
jgi:heat shock protein HtpX